MWQQNLLLPLPLILSYTTICGKIKEFRLSATTNTIRDCQVAIIGAGITGLSTAYHLGQAGVEDIVVLSDPVRAPAAVNTAGFTLGSLFDNITRVAHAYGLETAKEIYSFSQLARQSLIDFCQQQHVPVKLAPHLRLIVSSTELIESQKAVALFQQAGFDARGLATDADEMASLLLRCREAHARMLPCNPSAVLALQDDGLGGGHLDGSLLCQRLQALSQAEYLPAAVEQLCWQQDNSCVLQCGKHEIHCELVVLACHHHMVTLMPELEEIVIPYSDQWGSYRTEGNQLATGLVLTANHGHEWAVVVSKTEIHLGGARFLRRLAGTGDAVPCADAKITAYLQQRFLKFLPAITALHCERTVPLIGVRPCDELPIIGPMYGNDRILLATGFMGNGLSWGFQAGKCLADLICCGHSKTLPRQLWPERLRALPSSP